MGREELHLRVSLYNGVALMQGRRSCNFWYRGHLPVAIRFIAAVSKWCRF
jgi:hypothetical protein